ncbi:hypothetical protein OXX79_002519, partial [Metschnikowia pulcherrima]
HGAQGGNALSSAAANNNLSQNISQSTQQQQQLSAAQSHQQKLQHLINRPLPPIKQELPPHSNLSAHGNNDTVGGQAMLRNSQSNYATTQRVTQYEQQQVNEDEKKGFWAKLCCS